MAKKAQDDYKSNNQTKVIKGTRLKNAFDHSQLIPELPYARTTKNIYLNSLVMFCSLNVLLHS